MQGKIVDEDIEDLRQRSDIVEIISGYLQLKRTGRIFKGLCCFHQEKTPSFTVDPAKQLFHCFGCGAGGDVFTFLRQVEGMTFTESAERLAERAGMTLRFEGGGRAESGQRKRLFEANAAALELFANLLDSSPEGKGARKNWEARGFTREEAAEWKIGFSPPGRDVLYRHLLAKKFSSKEIIDAGLALITDSGEHRDRFRGRLMFPIWDVSGQVIGFGARALSGEQPKYLNSPETGVYRKAKVLYALNRAKAEMVRTGFAVVSEGYTDVIALHRAGFRNAVATCGTALGEDHFTLIKRFCDRVVLAFDSDAAGAIASERGFGIHSKVGLEVLVAPIPEGKDPADFALAEGPDAVERAIQEAQPLLRFVLEAEISRQRLDTAEAKAKAVRAAASILATESSRVARGEHAFWVARRIGVHPDQVQREIAEVADRSGPRRAPISPVRLPGHVKVEREALTLLLDSPSYVEQSKQWMTADHFTQPEHRLLFEVLFESSSAGPGVPMMSKLPDDATRALAAELALAPILTKNAEEVFLRLEEFRLQRQIESLRAKLDGLDPSTQSKDYDATFEELMRLEEQRRRFDDQHL